MISKTLSVLVLSSVLSSNALHAQAKLPVTISAEIGYPVSFGSTLLENATSLFAMDVNAQFPVSGKISLGPSVRANIYGDKVQFTDENGQVVRDDYYTSILTHWEVLSAYHINLAEKLKLQIGLAAGYAAIKASNLYNYEPGKSPKGFDIASGLTFQYLLSDHFALNTSAKYTFNSLYATSTTGGNSIEINDNFNELAFTLGAAYLF
ncbi:MAG: hypothetical protein IPO83_07890 [Chitinophagaceae bacterium]|nr:hypothetical protein [Chitinophagaceae bacterium]